MYYVVRINQKPQRKTMNIVKDFNYLLNELKQFGTGKWDKDTHNRIQVGDFIGFILDDGLVHFYKIIDEDKNGNRHSHWHSDVPYNQTTNASSPSHRDVIVLTSQGHFTHPWESLKKDAGYKDNYMPRGTTKVKFDPLF